MDHSNYVDTYRWSTNLYPSSCRTGYSVLQREKNQIIKMTKPLIPQDKNILYDLERESIYMAHLAKYVNDYGGYPIYKNTTVEYYSVGEEKYASMLYELEKAERFIFMEYFIIDHGKMWNTILDILERKAEQGVEVRLLYDGMGSQFLLPNHYDKYLETKVINAVYSMNSDLSFQLRKNNRDHRKNFGNRRNDCI